MQRFDIIRRSSFFILGLILIGPISFSALGIALISLKTAFLIALFLVLYVASVKATKAEDPLSLALILTAIIIMISDFPNRNHAMLEGIANPGFTASLLLSVSLLVLLLSKLNLKYATPLTLGLISLVFTFTFLNTIGYRLLFSDDHPTFLFRLETLKRSFPFVPCYNPLWNAGIHFRDFFASGALAIYILFLPIIYIFNLNISYNIIVVALFFFLPILISYLTCRVLKLNRQTFLILGILSLTSSTEWYRWGLSFGTVGFILATQLLPFFISFTWKITEREPLSKLEAFTALLFLTLMLLWPLAVLFTVPALTFCLFNFKRISANKSALITIVILLIINLPWMFKFYEVSRVENFIIAKTSNYEVEEIPINEALKSEKVLTANPGLKYYFNFLRQTARTTNSFILLFGLPGIFLIPSRKLKLLFLSTIIWLGFLSTFGSAIKPQLELDRFIISASYLLALPAAVFAANQSGNIRKTALCFIILYGLLGTFRILQNKTLIRFYPKEQIVEKLSQAILAHTKSGRAIFAGFILHDLSHGHIAPLVYTSGTPLIARSYKHDHWTHHEVIPSRYLKDKGRRIEEFFDIYNVESVITFNRTWRDYFRKKNDLYKEVWHQDKFRIFKRLKSKDSYFLRGTGDIIEQNADGVIFNLKSKDAVLKFNYIENLRVEGCELYPHLVEGAVTLVGLKNCEINTELKLSL